jgi:hypothetical protein
MKMNLLKKKDQDKPTEKKLGEPIPRKEEIPETTEKRNMFQIPGFQQYSALMKLRIVVSAIFLLSTIGLILIFVGAWYISAILLLLGYIFIFILMVKLLRIRKL